MESKKLNDLKKELKKIKPTDTQKAKDLVKIAKQIEQQVKIKEKADERKNRSRSLVNLGLIIAEGKKVNELLEIEIILTYQIGDEKKRIDEKVSLPFSFSKFISEKLPEGAEIIGKYIKC
jgi:hypothetical protein